MQQGSDLFRSGSGLAVESTGAGIDDHGADGCPEGLDGSSLVAPAKSSYAAAVESYDRNITLPSAIATSELIGGGAGFDSEDIPGDLGDLDHGGVVAGGHVEHGKWHRSMRGCEEHGVDDIFDVHVGLALHAIAEDPELRRVIEEAAGEVEPDSMGLVRTDHVAEPEGTAAQAEHECIGGDERFTSELRCPVGRYRHEGPIVLGSLEVSDVAIDTASRCVEDPSTVSSDAHCLHDMMSQLRPLIEVDGWICGGSGDIRIGSKMDDGVAPVDRTRESIEIEDIGSHDLKSIIGRERIEVPLATRREVVEHLDRLGGSVAEQPSDEMAADESGPTDDAHTTDDMSISD